MTLPSLNLQPIYLSKIFVCFNKEDWPEQTPTFTSPWPEDNDAGLCYEYGQDVYIAVKNVLTSTPDYVVDTLSHEAYHAVVKINTIIGDLSPSEEMTARMVGIITAFLFTEYMKKITEET